MPERERFAYGAPASCNEALAGAELRKLASGKPLLSA